jgi:hypothetical protein
MLDEPVLLEAQPPPVAEPVVEAHLVRSVASSASQLFLRRAVITGLSALSTAIVARKIWAGSWRSSRASRDPSPEPRSRS